MTHTVSVLRRESLAAAFLAFAVLLTASSAEAITIDSFDEVVDPTAYPITLDLPFIASVEERELAGVFGGFRNVFVFAGAATIPAPDGVEIDVVADIDAAAGELTVVAGDDSSFQLNLVWASDDSAQSVDFDLTPFDRIVLEYSATVAFALDINLANNTPGVAFPPDAALQGRRFALPAAVDGVVEVPIAAIDELQFDVDNSFPNDLRFFPPLDPTSLDSITITLSALEGGGSIALRDVSIVPEPAAIGLLAVGVVGFARRR